MVLYVCSEKKKCTLWCCSFVLLSIQNVFFREHCGSNAWKLLMEKHQKLNFQFVVCVVLHQREMSHTYSASWYHEGGEYNKDICQKRRQKSDTPLEKRRHTDWIFQNGVVTQFYMIFLSWFNFSCLSDQTLITMWKFSRCCFSIVKSAPFPNSENCSDCMSVKSISSSPTNSLPCVWVGSSNINWLAHIPWRREELKNNHHSFDCCSLDVGIELG